MYMIRLDKLSHKLPEINKLSKEAQKKLYFCNIKHNGHTLFVKDQTGEFIPYERYWKYKNKDAISFIDFYNSFADDYNNDLKEDQEKESICKKCNEKFDKRSYNNKRKNRDLCYPCIYYNNHPEQEKYMKKTYDYFYLNKKIKNEKKDC